MIILVMLHLKTVVEDQVEVLEVSVAQISQTYLKIFLEILGEAVDQEVENQIIEDRI